MVHVHRKAWSLWCRTPCPLSSAASSAQPHTAQLTVKPFGSLDGELLGITKPDRSSGGGACWGAPGELARRSRALGLPAAASPWLDCGPVAEVRPHLRLRLPGLGELVMPLRLSVLAVGDGAQPGLSTDCQNQRRPPPSVLRLAPLLPTFESRLSPAPPSTTGTRAGSCAGRAPEPLAAAALAAGATAAWPP